MTQAGRAGRASIEIVGDVSKLGRQLERDAQRAVSDIDLDTGNISDQLGDAFKDGVDEATGHLGDLDRAVAQSSDGYVERFEDAAGAVADAFADTLPDISGYLDQLAETAGDAADDVALHFEAGGVRISKVFKDNGDDADRAFEGMGRTARETSEDIQTNMIRPLTAGFNRVGEVISSAGSALVGLALTGINPAGLLTLTLWTIAIVALAPLVIGLGAALADLAGIATLLPAAIGSLAAVLIVGTVAFNGFGDAISAVLDGDPEKIAEALERLAPAARTVVREFQAVLPIFRQVGDAIQQSFFSQLVGVVEQFGESTLPRLQTRLETLAAVMGRAFSTSVGLLNATENVGILERLLVSTSRITNDLGYAFAALGQAFLNAIDAGLPGLEKLSGRLADALTNFALFINGSIEDGSFQQFLDDAVATLDELLALGGAVGELLGVLFGGTDDAGRGFIGTLTDVTKRMTEFFKSAEGKDTIEDFAEIIVTLGAILGWTINVLIWLIDRFNELDDAVQAVIVFFMDLGSAISDAWDWIVEKTSSAVESVKQFFSDLWSDAKDIWNRITETISGAIDRVVTFFEELPGKISEFIESIPDRVAEAFGKLEDRVLTILALMIAAVIVFFTDMPRQIVGALTAFVVMVRELFIEARDRAIEALLNVWEFIQSVPGLLAAAWEAVVTQVTDVFTRVRDFITTTWENVLVFIADLPRRFGEYFQQVGDAVVARVTTMIEYVQGLPDRIIGAIGNAGTMLYDSGSKIIQGLIDGIGSRIGKLREKISSAVQEIRDRLPFSPAKKGPLSGSGSPERAGAVIGSMIASGLDGQNSLISDAANRAAAAAGISLSPLGDAGVTPLAMPIPGQRGTVLSPTSERTDEQLVVIVNIDGKELTAIIDQRVEAAVNTEVRRLMAGTRGT